MALFSKPKPNFDTIVDALKKVLVDPEKKQDLVSQNMVRDLKVFENGNVSFRISVPESIAKAKEQVKTLALSAVKGVANVGEVTIIMDVQVNKPGQNPGKVPEQHQSVAKGIPGIANIIAVSSGKGGVGKSTVSVNLAASLALLGARVGIMDADIYGPNLPTMMGVTENPRLIKDEVKGDIFLPPMSHGVKVMSMGFLIEGDQPVIWRGPMLHNILNQFCTKVAWGELDYLIIDLPPGTGDVQLSLAQMLPMTGAVIVTTPQEIALQDVRKAMNMWDKVKVPIIGIVENMSYFKGDDGKEYKIFGEGGGESLARKFNTKVLAKVPLVMEVREGSDVGKPIVIRNPGLEPAIRLREAAKKVAQEVLILSNHNSHSPSLEIGQF